MRIMIVEDVRSNREHCQREISQRFVLSNLRPFDSGAMLVNSGNAGCVNLLGFCAIFRRARIHSMS